MHQTNVLGWNIFGLHLFELSGLCLQDELSCAAVIVLHQAEDLLKDKLAALREAPSHFYILFDELAEQQKWNRDFKSDSIGHHITFQYSKFVSFLQGIRVVLRHLTAHIFYLFWIVKYGYWDVGADVLLVPLGDVVKHLHKLAWNFHRLPGFLCKRRLQFRFNDILYKVSGTWW